MRLITRTCGARLLSLSAVVALALSCGAAATRAAEHPAGQPLDINGMHVMAVYLQPVEMEPKMRDQDPAQSDIHLEADIHALAKNANGFSQDSWIPYLTVAYRLAKNGSAWHASGVLHPMVADDGPHYGANVKLDGPGAYEVVFEISPPSSNRFMRHVDKETGVASWWQPFRYRGSFAFIGIGKKGGY